MLTIQELILVFALIGVLGGWAMGRIGSWFGYRKGAQGNDQHSIRALEAALRIAQRKAEEAELALEQLREETEAIRRQFSNQSGNLSERDEEVLRLRQSLTDECLKTQGLRAELSHRAEETIRASVRVKDAETELSVARAGSDAVLDQIQKLAAEREELTGRLRALQTEADTRGAYLSKVTRLPLRDPKER